VSQKFRIVEKIPQEPAQLPHGFLGAIKAPDDGLPGEFVWFEDREAKNVEGLLSVPTELRVVDADEEDSIRDLRS
jgi:hypothetical protein